MPYKKYLTPDARFTPPLAGIWRVVSIEFIYQPLNRDIVDVDVVGCGAIVIVTLLSGPMWARLGFDVILTLWRGWWPGRNVTPRNSYPIAAHILSFTSGLRPCFTGIRFRVG
jgi:hypothetical protein